MAGVNHETLVVKKPPLGNLLYKYRYFYLMAIPVVVLLLIFFYWPMLGIRFAFSTYKLKHITSGAGPDYSTGFGNFVALFKDKFFIDSFRNTVVLSFWNLVFSTVFTVIVALLINELQHEWAKKFVQTVLYLPHFLSWVVVASIFTLLLSAGADQTGTDLTTVGFVNAIFMKLGFIDHPIAFLTTKETWRPAWYIIQRWKETGWGTIIYLAALSGISPDLYEAAEIDGAGRMKQTWYITLPSLMDTILIVFILNLAKILNVFESVFVLYNELVYSVSDVIQTYTYRKGIQGNDYGYSTAIGLFKSVISLFLVTGADYVAKRIRGYGIV